MHAFALIRDHLTRTIMSFVRGFRSFGPSWVRVAAFYAVHPLVGRLARGRTCRVSDLRLRCGETDAYVFANIVVDYDPVRVKRCLREVRQVIDAGANIGAFVWLVRQFDPRIKVIALEPNAQNFDALRTQPFAATIEAKCEALGKAPGWCHIVAGENAASHRTAPTQAGPDAVRVRALPEIVTADTLLKIDIEGAERDVLATGLPAPVKFMFLEWHYPGSPADIVSYGRWTLLRQAAPAESMWFWERDPATAV